MAGQDFTARTIRRNWIPSAARTTHPNNYDDITIQRAKGVKVYIDITAFSGTSITFTLSGLDPASGTVYTVLASAAKSATGAFQLTVAPWVATAANVSLSDIAPSKLRLTTSGTITSVTWQASVELID